MSDIKAQSIGDRLTAAEGERRFPNVRPRNAATLIIIDRSGGDPKVLMGRRHAGHRFMPGKYVFPGGRIERADGRMAIASALHQRAERALSARTVRPSPHLGRMLALAAIRETFEETGLLLGSKEHGAAPGAPAGPWQAFADRGVLPDLGRLQVIARAITPPKRPKRFDTRFFAVDRTAIAGEVVGVVGPDTELVELTWVTLAEARSLDLPMITLTVLGDLEERIGAGFTHELPIPFYYAVRQRFVRELL